MQFYASPDDIKAAGQPTKQNLASHQTLSYVDADRMLSYLVPAGLELTRANFRFTSTSQFVALQIARNGLGLVILPERAVKTAADLVRVELGIDAFDLPTWLVTHSELKTSRRIRFVFDYLSEKLC